MTKEQIEAELRLFKAYSQVFDDFPVYENTASVDKGILYTATVSEDIKLLAEKMYGIKPEEWNNTFHKSFQTVLDTPIEKLIMQQIVHYFTTYGLESVGAFDSDLVYIPHEKLEIPELEEDIVLTVIKYINENELQEALMTLVTSCIALSKQTVNDVMLLADYIDKTKLDEIKNREIKIAMYDKYNVVPKNNMEFLRFVVYKLTGSTLYIQSNDMIHLIQKADANKKYEYLYNYVRNDDGYKKLAEIYRRNKKIFLAFKVKQPTTKLDKSINQIINKVSKLASIYHKPIKTNILDNLNSLKLVKDIDNYRIEILNELDKVTVFREIRIIDGLRYRLKASIEPTDEDSIVYRIRNGKIFATNFDRLNTDKSKRVTQMLIDLIERHLEQRVETCFKDKTVYIPDNVNYVAPTSEKQFVGNFPEGSYVEIPRKSRLVVGVHWKNLDNERIDLDLKMMNLTEHYGWNASYLSDRGDIVFSGDVTDAPSPKGATEVFLITNDVIDNSFLIKLNDFTMSKNEVPFEFFVVEFDNGSLNRDFVVDPNKVVFMTHNSFDKVTGNERHASKTLGYVVVNRTSIKIYFKNFEDVKGRISEPDKVNRNVFNYTDLYSKTQLTLNDLILKCGGKLVSSPNVENLEEVNVDGETLYKKIIRPVDIDLSTDKLTKDSIIKLFQGV